VKIRLIHWNAEEAHDGALHEPENRAGEVSTLLDRRGRHSIIRNGLEDTGGNKDP
jgi:hypothetical protein